MSIIEQQIIDLKSQIKSLTSALTVLEQQAANKPLIEVAPKESEKQCSWDEAVKYCTFLGSLGPGWRLPTKEELQSIYDGLHDFEWGGIYWTSTPHDEHPNYHVWVQLFDEEGKVGYGSRLSRHIIRPVRDIIPEAKPLPFEIADKSTEILDRWEVADKFCKSLGDGWRLPTIDELRLLSNHVVDFAPSIYWSATKDGDDYVYVLNMSNNEMHRIGSRFNSVPRHARAIKDL